MADRPTYVWTGSGWDTIADPGAVRNSLVQASKGALITSTGSAVAALTVGTNGHVLTAASGETLGVKWAAVADSGLVLITKQDIRAATTLSINNCFSSTYQNYRFVLTASGTMNGQRLYARLRVSSTDTTSDYFAGAFGVDQTTTSATIYRSTGGGGGASTQFDLSWISNTDENCLWTGDIGRPFAAARTQLTGTMQTIHQGVHWMMGTFGGVQSGATSFDGITFYSAQNWTGSIRIYGYKDSV